MEETINGITINYLDFDIYSKSIGFFYNDKERIGSLFGFILTSIYIFITLLLFIYYTITTIQKSDIKVHDSLLYQKEVPEMHINNSIFYFAFGVENYFPDSSMKQFIIQKYHLFIKLKKVLYSKLLKKSL